jgi:hypothetical protein
MFSFYRVPLFFHLIFNSEEPIKGNFSLVVEQYFVAVRGRVRFPDFTLYTINPYFICNPPFLNKRKTFHFYVTQQWEELGLAFLLKQ